MKSCQIVDDVVYFMEKTFYFLYKIAKAKFLV
jgi:hypothetical protein